VSPRQRSCGCRSRDQVAHLRRRDERVRDLAQGLQHAGAIRELCLTLHRQRCLDRRVAAARLEDGHIRHRPDRERIIRRVVAIDEMGELGADDAEEGIEPGRLSMSLPCRLDACTSPPKMAEQPRAALTIRF